MILPFLGLLLYLSVLDMLKHLGVPYKFFSENSSLHLGFQSFQYTVKNKDLYLTTACKTFTCSVLSDTAQISTIM